MFHVEHLLSVKMGVKRGETGSFWVKTMFHVEHFISPSTRQSGRRE
jgi:hypothetical protein